ncbi:Methyltransferase domain-containing protein [Rhodovastum atsumiense]|uniref:Methyltransferase domain-containing protein n=1 Tax=Rhodovastum atsumiense TaxID=504468 RepID=A0A5M6IXA0_9PROT|nr:class I SAM-dependent methyltransferase [Rhodovastum atsumiense]KAA5611995.1 methyltransferase domain-containing protein [Rhodovastum atsumiense]CAH2598775.1 Methyltransferase domain-containing protein [Rhodovastum atsumiense]
MSQLSLALDTEDLAQYYEEVSANRQFRVGTELVAALGIAPGERVLDVGSGTGLLAAHIATLVQPGGTVTGIDPLPLRIALARQKNLANARFEVGDANDLSAFASASFDVVLLNAVFHWLPEKRGPLHGFARVLAPGGRLGISTGSREHRGALQTIKAEVLARPPFNQYPQARDGVPHHITAAELRDLLQEAGFIIRSLEIVPTRHLLPDGDAAVRFSEASSFGNFLGHLPVQIREQARQAIVEELDRGRTDEGIVLGGARVVAIAHTPSADGAPAQA